VWPEGLGKFKIFIHLIRSRTRNLSACSIVRGTYKMLNKKCGTCRRFVKILRFLLFKFDIQYAFSVDNLQYRITLIQLIQTLV
jgi:hypothetical protein